MTVSEICDGITSFIKSWSKTILLPVPAAMLICSTIKRGGLSPMLITSRIISRQQEFGGRVGVNIDGSPNRMNQMFYVIVDEILKAIKMDGKVEIAIPPGGISSVGTGANSGGPVVVTSVNTNPVKGEGIIR